MEITNKTQLLEFLRKQSLKLLSENQAFADKEAFQQLEKKITDVDEHFVDVNEKNFERLKREEEAAIKKEDYADLQRIKNEKKELLGKLIASYKKKVDLFTQLQNALETEIQDMGTKGSNVFKDKEINEFNGEEFQKGDTIKLSTIATEIVVKKISDNNQYQVLDSSAPGILAGDVLALPNMKIGSSAPITVYRKFGDRFNEIGKPTIQNLRKITKNPS